MMISVRLKTEHALVCTFSSLQTHSSEWDCSVHAHKASADVFKLSPPCSCSVFLCPASVWVSMIGGSIDLSQLCHLPASGSRECHCKERGIGTVTISYDSSSCCIRKRLSLLQTEQHLDFDVPPATIFSLLINFKQEKKPNKSQKFLICTSLEIELQLETELGLSPFSSVDCSKQGFRSDVWCWKMKVHSSPWTGFNPPVSSHSTNNALWKQTNQTKTNMGVSKTPHRLRDSYSSVHWYMLDISVPWSHWSRVEQVLGESLSIPYGYSCNSISQRTHSGKTLQRTKRAILGIFYFTWEKQNSKGRVCQQQKWHQAGSTT